MKILKFIAQLAPVFALVGLLSIILGTFVHSYPVIYSMAFWLICSTSSLALVGYILRINFGIGGKLRGFEYVNEVSMFCWLTVLILFVIVP